MPRYRLTLEYDGSGYNGFQAQTDQPTVQGAVERAITAFCGQTVRIATGDGVVRLLRVQRAGKAVQTPDEMLRGFAVPAGTVLA